MFKTLFIGAAFIDDLMEVERLPKSGEDISAYNEKVLVGGCALNAARVLNAEKGLFSLLAPIGSGKNGKLIEHVLNEEGIEIILRVPQDNGYCISLIEKNGERTFITLSSAECDFLPEWFSHIKPSDFNAVYISGYEIEGRGGKHIVDFLESCRIPLIFYAPGPRCAYIDPDIHKRICKLSPIVHLNETEVLQITKKNEIKTAASYLQEQIGGAAVIVTLGAQGALVLENGVFQSIPAVPAKVVDTSGAGDAHIGGVIHALSLGKTLIQAVEFGNKVSARVVASQGPKYIKESVQEEQNA